MELAPRKRWRDGGKPAIEEAIRDVLTGYPGITTTFTQPIQMRTSEMLTGSSADIAVKIFGPDLATLARLTDRATTLISGVEGTADVKASVSEGGKYLAVEVRPEVAAQQGLDTATLGARLQAQLEGLSVAEIIEGERRVPLRIGSAAADGGDRPASTAALSQRVVLLPDGSAAALEDIARISYSEGPVLIEREQGKRFGLVGVNVADRDVVSVVDDIRAVLSEPGTIPKGYSVSYGGDFENQQRAAQRLMLLVPFALVLIILILFSTLGGLSRTAIILGNIPLALMGGLLTLFASGEYLSVPASVGLIALMGVSVLNGVVMLTRLDALRDSGTDLAEIVVEGATSRLRPVLMTAVTAIMGLVPLVFASGPGAEIQRPLAIVVIGGLFTATITTLYLLPLVYLRLESRHGR
jgi:cobalt-zinc-cadmium resistance protein CzcA